MYEIVLESYDGVVQDRDGKVEEIILWTSNWTRQIRQPEEELDVFRSEEREFCKKYYNSASTRRRPGL